MPQLPQLLIATIATAAWVTSMLGLAQGTLAQQPTGRSGSNAGKSESVRKASSTASGKSERFTAPQPVGASILPPAVAMAAGLDPQFLSLKIRYRQRLKPLLLADLLHAKVVCHLSPEQLRKIRPEANIAFESATTELAQYDATSVAIKRDDAQREQRFANGLPVSRTMPPRPAAPDPVAAMQSSITAIIRKHVTPELFAKYLADIERRDRFRRTAALRVLMSVLDRELMLSREQSQKLAPVFAEHWQDSWMNGIAIAYNGAQILPTIGDEQVMPILSESQRRIWRTLPKVSGTFWTAGMFAFDPPGLDEALGAIPAGKPGRIDRGKAPKIGSDPGQIEDKVQTPRNGNQPSNLNLGKAKSNAS